MLLGSIHPFPSKEFSSERSVSLGFFFALSFFIHFPVHFHPRGVAALPALPRSSHPSLPSPRRGPGSGPGALAAPCPAELRRWPRRWEPAQAEVLEPKSGSERSLEQAAPTPVPCRDPLPTAHVPSQESLNGWRRRCIWKPSHVKGLMLPRSTRGHGQDIPSQGCWNGGLSPPRGCLSHPIPLCTAVWLLERCLDVVTELPGGVESFASPGANDAVLTGCWGYFGVQGAGARCSRALALSPCPSGWCLVGRGVGVVLCPVELGLCTLFLVSVKNTGCC